MRHLSWQTILTLVVMILTMGGFHSLQAQSTKWRYCVEVNGLGDDAKVYFSGVFSYRDQNYNYPLDFGHFLTNNYGLGRDIYPDCPSFDSSSEAQSKRSQDMREWESAGSKVINTGWSR
jgi:hypothetical protein